MSRMRPFLGPSALVGLMSGMTPNGVNLVSAPLLAAEAGIRLSCQEEGQRDGARAVRVTLTRDGRSHSAAGTVQGDQPTLLELDGASFESGVMLGGNMLFFEADGSGQALMAVISTLSTAGAQLLTVLTSGGVGGRPLVAVRTQARLETPELLNVHHAKFLLQTQF